MNTRHARMILAIVREGSFTAAAKARLLTADQFFTASASTSGIPHFFAGNGAYAPYPTDTGAAIAVRIPPRIAAGTACSTTTAAPLSEMVACFVVISSSTRMPLS